MNDGVRVNAINPGLIETERFGRNIERVSRDHGFTAASRRSPTCCPRTARHARRAARGDRLAHRLSGVGQGRLHPGLHDRHRRRRNALAVKEARHGSCIRQRGRRRHRRASPTTSWPSAGPICRTTCAARRCDRSSTSWAARSAARGMRWWISPTGALTEYAGAPHATVIGRGHKADALHACLINCLSSSIYSYDDTHAEAVVHPAGPVATAALALAEQRRQAAAPISCWPGSSASRSRAGCPRRSRWRRRRAPSPGRRPASPPASAPRWPRRSC